MTKKPNDNQEPQDEPVNGAQAPSAEPAGAEAALRAERDELLGRLQRVSADFANYQKRVQRDIDESRQFANAELIRTFLDVLDDLERAIEHARANHPAEDPLLVGTQLVYDKAQGILRQFGVEEIQVKGAFDPALHQAIMQQPTAEAPPMTVLSVAQKGYSLRGRMLRPAKVVVAAPPAEPADEDCDACGPADEPHME